ncbi:MAG: T9SS type A sorting domain-containing protein [Ignavibacteriales bacterium]|nr:T9SS type A sorting domain-containing protein [Ignavibacteriales bacterium]
MIMLDSNIIVLTEIDTSGRFARCICMFELQHQLIGVGSGHYDVEVYRAFLQKYGYPKDTTIFIGTTSFDVGNIFMPPVMSNFIQSPCGGFVGVNAGVTDESRRFGLSQNYPNPFNPLTVIRYQLPISGWVTMKVYDVIGRDVVTLVNEFKKIGSYEVKYDGTKLPAGVYFYRLISGNYSKTKKLVLLK